eukprot:scaffold6002_cov110-Isochrysis_galbana.AAC.7
MPPSQFEPAVPCAMLPPRRPDLERDVRVHATNALADTNPDSFYDYTHKYAALVYIRVPYVVAGLASFKFNTGLFYYY